MLDLGLGDPAPELLPLEALGVSAGRFFAAGEAEALQYGAERGHPGLRRALAAFLAPRYGAAIDPEAMFICHGASGALALLCTLYTRPGDTVLVEEPTYFLALRIFADHGLRVKPLTMDAHGLDVEAVAAALADPPAKGRVAMLYTVPTYQNPSGRTLPVERRARLAQLSHEHGFLLAADEVYHLLRYDGTESGGPPPGAFSGYTQYTTVASIGSFSKILAPGLRAGWVIAHPETIARLAGCGLLDSGGGLAPLTGALLCDCVERGALGENVARLQRAYAARRDALHAALQQYAPQFQYSLPQGGFFFWLRLPGADTAALRPQARAAGVDFRPGERFSPRRALNEYLRAGFSFYDEERLAEAARRLGESVESWQHH